MAMCQFRGLGKVRIWGWDILMAKISYFGGFPCIGCTIISKVFCNLFTLYA